ncbi:hypothetical protein Q3G72_011570 [Acer saccharum]|nr:hypothetical protein Q3G72_011570 [Acer saccharum]
MHEQLQSLATVAPPQPRTCHQQDPLLSARSQTFPAQFDPAAVSSIPSPTSNRTSPHQIRDLFDGTSCTGISLTVDTRTRRQVLVGGYVEQAIPQRDQAQISGCGLGDGELDLRV